MRTNGSLVYATFSGGGFTADGDPIQQTVVWSDLIECLIITQTDKNKLTIDNEKSNGSVYEIHIPIQSFSAETIRLTNDRGVFLGEFRVHSIQFLDAVQRVSIIV